MTIYLDLDGVLLSVSARYHAVYGSLIAGLGGVPLDAAAYWSLKRLGWKESRICAAHHVACDARRYASRFVEEIESPQVLAHDHLVDGALRTLGRLRGSHRLVLCTLRRRGAALRTQIEALGIAALLEDVLNEDDNDGDWRVKAGLMSRDMLRSGDSPGAPAMLVGDSEGDILAARHAGVISVVVLNGMRGPGILAANDPGHLIEDITRIGRCLPAGDGETRWLARESA